MCVTVTENTAKRRLEASVAVTRIYTDEGAEVSEVIKPQDDGSFALPFTNTAQRQSATVSALATKRLIGRDIVTGEFGFRMDAVPLDDEQAAHFPMPAGAQTDPETGRPYVTTINAGSQVSFGQITFTDADYGESVDYYYELSEIVPDDAVNADGVTWAAASEHERAAGGFAKDGVTYTSQHYIMWVHLEYAGADDDIMTATVTYYRGDWPATGQSGLGGAGHEEFVPADHDVNGVLFENEYRSSFHTNLIQVTKRLIGRAMTAEDGFEIVAEGSDEASASLLKTALTGGDGVMEGSKLVFRPGAAADGELVKMSAGSLTLTQDDAGTAQNPKVYTWVISEHIPSDDEKLPGVTYDRKQLRLQFSVVDDQKGTIQVTPTLTRMYDTDGAPDGSRVNLDIIFDRDTKRYSLDFTNVFEAKETYTGVDVLKTMVGREMRDGEFRFRAVAADYQSALKLFELYQSSPEEYAAEQEFSAPAADDGATVRMEKLRGLTFTQDDVRDGDNWYSYYYVESLPNRDDDDSAAGIQQHGVTFDETAYRVDISPRLDEQTGALYTITEVYQGLRDQEFSDTPVATFDSRDGKLPELAFENSYKAASVTVRGAMLTKKLEGRDWQADDTFSFRYTQESYQADGVTMKPGDAGYVGVDIPDSVVDASSEGTGTEGVRRFGFADVVYSEPGVYTYTVRENKPADGGLPGVAYSDEVARVTVTVVDLGRGRLLAFPQASDIEDGHDAHFTNVYTPQDASVSTDGLFSKTLAGRDWHENETFTFDMRALDPADAPLPAGAVDGVASVKVGADNAGAFGFGSIAFGAKDMAGATSRTFRYAVSERVPDDAVNADGVRWKDADASQRAAGGFAKDGMTYDAHEAIFAVTVTDDGAGALQASAPTFKGEGTPQAFENAYTAAPVSVELGARKELSGRDLRAGEFTFALTEQGADASVLTAVNDAQGRVAFDELVFSEPGEHIYTMAEVAPDAGAEAGVTYDATVYTVRVAVTDDGAGTLHADMTVLNGTEPVDGTPTFSNTYTAELDYDAAQALGISKVLDGRAMVAGQFGFTMQAADAAAAKVLGIDEDSLTREVTVPAAADGTAARVSLLPAEGVTLTRDDAGKTYRYTVRETRGGGAGYTNDATVYTVEIAVTDNGDGTLTATTRATGTNGFAVQSVCTTGDVSQVQAVELPFENAYAAAGSLAVTARKELTGRDLRAGEFTFALDLLSMSTSGQDARRLGEAANAADGSILFEPIALDIAELKQLVADGYATASTGGDGAAWQLRLRVSEDASELPAGVSAQVPSVELVATVRDAGDGTLAVELAEPAGGAVLKNVYSAGDPVAVTPVGAKVLAHAEGLAPASIAGKFTFTLEAVTDGAPMPEGAGAQAVNDEAGNVVFGSISFGQEMLEGVAPGPDGSREKAFTYRVRESGQMAGVENDAAASAGKEFTYILRDDGAGRLSVAADAADGPVFTFTNTYTASPVSVGVTARKELSGRPLRDGEFAFTLVEQGGSGVELTADSDAAGTVAFDQLTFTEPGEHVYTLAEVVPGAGDAADGVAYDAAVYTVRVTVADDGAGKLVASVRVTDAAGNEVAGATPTFSNAYEPQGAAAVVAGTKVLTGRDLADGEFTFELVDADGQVLQTVQNAADGQVVFAPLTYGADDLADASWVSQDGSVSHSRTFAYAVREQVPADAVNADGVTWAQASEAERAAGGFAKDNVTYDGVARPVTVTVSDDGSGGLRASVAWGGSAVFTNAYERPSVPWVPIEPSEPVDPDGPDEPTVPGDPATPQEPTAPGDTEEPDVPAGSGDLPGTGDEALGMVALAAVGGAAAVGVGTWLRRRKR